MLLTPVVSSFYFAEGYTGTNFEEWLCILNMDAGAGIAQVTYLYADGTTPLIRDYILPAFSRSTLYVNDEAGAGRDVSVKVDSNVHIVAERPMYFNYQAKWTGGHDVIGAPAPATDFYFAEGYTGDGFEEWLCLMNPGAATDAHVTYMFADGSDPLTVDYHLAATSRATVNVNAAVGAGRDVSMQVKADAPIVAERPMYFNYRGLWTGGHDVIGAPAPMTSFYFAEGYTGEGFEEWLCLMNPGTSETTAHITYVFDNGAPPSTRT